MRGLRVGRVCGAELTVFAIPEVSSQPTTVIHSPGRRLSGSRATLAAAPNPDLSDFGLGFGVGLEISNAVDVSGGG